jgi:hypothetical protein
MAELSRIALGLTGALVLAGAAVGPAQAGGRCSGSSCYELVHRPAVFDTVAETVVVAPARTVARHIPAVTDVVHEQVVVRPARTVAHRIPAEYGTVAEKVLVAPAGKVWTVRVDHHGRHVGCWVDVPAKYAIRHRTVLVREAAITHETIPAIVQTRQRVVVVEPARTVHETIPAKTRVVHRQVMIEPASSGWAPIRRH